MVPSNHQSLHSFSVTSTPATLSGIDYFTDEDDLVVYEVTSTGAVYTLAKTTHYTVAGAGVEAGGTVTLTARYGSGTSTIAVFNNPVIQQDADYVPNDRFPAATHEAALDRLTLLVSALKARAGRALQVAVHDTTAEADLTLSASRASKVLGFDAQGRPSYPISTADLAALVAGSTIQPVGYVTPEMYGAVGDGVTNDTAALQSAIDSGKPVLLGAKTYLIRPSVVPVVGDTYVLTAPSGAVIRGLDRTRSVIKLANACVGASTDKITLLGNEDDNDPSGSCVIENVRFDGNFNAQTTAPANVTGCICGIVLGGSGNLVENCDFVGISHGVTVAYQESFVVLLGGTFTALANNVIRGCRYFGDTITWSRAGTSSNTTVFYSHVIDDTTTGGLPSGGLLYGEYPVGVIEHCEAYDYYNSHVYSGQWILHNTAVGSDSNLGRAVYLDYWPYREIRIDGNVFENVYFGIYLNFNTDGHLHADRILIENNKIRLREVSTGATWPDARRAIFLYSGYADFPGTNSSAPNQAVTAGQRFYCDGMDIPIDYDYAILVCTVNGTTAASPDLSTNAWGDTVTSGTASFKVYFYSYGLRTHPGPFNQCVIRGNVVTGGHAQDLGLKIQMALSIGVVAGSVAVKDNIFSITGLDLSGPDDVSAPTIIGHWSGNLNRDFSTLSAP